jgi:hypothetical protein
MEDRASILRLAKLYARNMHDERHRPWYHEDPNWKTALIRWSKFVTACYDLSEWKLRGRFLERRILYLERHHNHYRRKYARAKRANCSSTFNNVVIGHHNKAMSAKLQLHEEKEGLKIILIMLDEAWSLDDPAVSHDIHCLIFYTRIVKVTVCVTSEGPCSPRLGT